ncbi:MAG: lipopolysaccharide heptosyltransferase II [Phycisphaerae bacterium]|nr:lipopolysaccharide heptosyltransferase II [Phycisphaerae bacterium]
MSELAGREFERILIIKPSSPGDIIHALPVLRRLRTRYPRAHIAWLVSTAFVNLLDADPSLDEVIPFDRKRYGRLGRSVGATIDFVRFVRDLRARRFDLVVDLQGLIRSGLISFFSGAGFRIGFRGAREGAWFFYNHRVDRLPADMHAADKILALGRMLGLPEDSPDFRVAVTPADRRVADELLAEAGIEAEGRFAVLVPGTRWETKRWPAFRFGELARVLYARHGLRSVLVGSESDVADGRIAEDSSRISVSGRVSADEPATEAAAWSLCGRTTFRQLAAIIDRAAVVVTADSAPMHIAAGHGRPLVALFGPTNPYRTGPYGKMDGVVKLPLACSPCYLRALSQCPHGHQCLLELTVDKVAERVGAVPGL